jgi:UDP-N-acetylglucosamine--N-acetylmuramyl-(pentapeptide) pyrophosphoryl-undecaprenol N-acetylglucosamine transferase
MAGLDPATHPMAVERQRGTDRTRMAGSSPAMTDKGASPLALAANPSIVATAATHPIVIAAGGTGGHFFPAEALAAELIRRGHRIVLMTDARSGGLRSAVFAEREHFVLQGSGIAGRGAIKAAKGALALLTGIRQARRIIRDLHPAVVVGFGGYPAVAPVVAAAFSRPRPAIILHEQNGVLGRANRMLSRWCATLALSLRATTRVPHGTRTEVTGNPVRPEIRALVGTFYTPPHADIRLLILGGSLGARVFSDVVPAALVALPDALRVRLSVTQQCRIEDMDRVRAAYDAAGIKADLAPFFSDVAVRLASAHLVIARAGASTVAEIAVAGRPAILVPLPGAIDNHQEANARALSDVPAAWMIRQPAFTAAALTERLAALLTDPTTLALVAQAAQAAARPDAAARLADLVEAHMHQEARS